MTVNLDNIIFHNPPGLSLPDAHSLPKPFKNPSSFVPASAPASFLPPVAPMLPNQPSGFSQKLPTLPLSLRSPTPLSLPPKPPPVLPLPKKPPTVLPFTQYLYQHPSPLGSQSPKCFHGSELEVPETQRNIFCIDWPAVETRDLTMNEFPKQKECEDPHLLPASNNIPSYIDEVISPGYSILDCRAAVCNIDPAILETQSPKGPDFTALPESNITMPNSLPAILDRAKCDDTEDLSISINSGVKGDKNQRVNSYDSRASVEPIFIRESPTPLDLSHELNSQDIASSPCEKGGGSSNKERAKKGKARGILKRARAVAVEIPIPHNHLSSVSYHYPGVHNKSSREVVKGDDNHISSDDDQEDSDYSNSKNDGDMSETGVPKRRRITLCPSSLCTLSNKGNRSTQDIETLESERCSSISWQDSSSGQSSDRSNPPNLLLTLTSAISKAVLGAVLEVLAGSSLADERLIGSKKGLEQCPTNPRRGKGMNEGGRTARWTPKEDKQLLALWERGESWSELRENFGQRTESSLRQRLSKLRKDNKRKRTGH